MNRSLATSRARAFTLVEVLIGVLILSLGLLGLAALFPAVLREQRIARDEIGGAAAVQAAKAYLSTHGVLNHPRQFVEGTPVGWYGWASRASSGYDQGLTWRVSLQTGGLATSFYDSGDGVLEIPLPTPARIPVVQRLFPAGDWNLVEPAYVWDIAACLARGVAAGQGGPVRVAVFVRRIDPAIRVPEGTKPLPDGRPYTLGDVLDQAVMLPSPNDRRLPVGVDASGLPTLDGTDGAGGITRYAVPLYADVSGVIASRAGGPLDTLRLSSLPAAQQPLVAQIGQKLVDNFGTVYTVIGVPNPAQMAEVRVEPLPSAEAVRSATSPSPARTQVVFTPQIPVAVSVMEFGG